MQKKYKLIISYDGTAYPGWQVQPKIESIHAIIQKGIETILRQKIALTGSSRTDAGVHALGQVAHFEVSEIPDFGKFLYSLNSLLPKDIRILAIEEVPADFHARYSALSKTYHYHLYLDGCQDPFSRLYSYHVHKKIDKNLLLEACPLFVGTHDFTSFANEAYRGSAKNKPVKTMKRLDAVMQKGGVRLEFEADGYLYKMVRTIVGTLLMAAAGDIPLAAIEKIFAAKDRKLAGPAVPPHGLFLVHINYGNPSDGIKSKLS